MPQNARFIQPFTAKRVRWESSRAFDEVLLNLRKIVGTAIPQDPDISRLREDNQKSGETLGKAYLAAMQRLGGVSREHFEQVVRFQVGESGFMLFLDFNYGEWLPLFGIQRKVARWILGNPLVAVTMIRHDITASLFAPVELLLVENESREGSTLLYDIPSSLMVIEHNPFLLEAAQALDQQLETLVRRVLE